VRDDDRGAIARDVMSRPIGELATRDVVHVSPDLTVDELERLLLARDLSGVPVVDDDMRLVGFVAMTDIVRRLHPLDHTRDRDHDAHAVVADIMRLVPFELQVSSPVAGAIEAMSTRHLHRVPVVDEGGTLVGIVTASDIARALARTVAASEPGATNAQRGETDRLLSLGFLAGGIAHQANNALTSMRLSLGRLVSFEQSRRPQSPESLHRIELLQDVREGVFRIERIIRELKAFSQVDDGPTTTTEVSALLDVAIGFVAHEIRHRARLVRDYANVPPIRARTAELRQVFINLLVNAAQAIGEGEAHLNEIRVATRTDLRGRVVIEISDTGSGIAPDLIGHIFEPFFTTKRPGGSLGLGLALARDVVESLQGDVTIDSTVGKGTSVRISLPASDVAMQPAPAPEPRPSRVAHATRRRILIVDDDRPVAAAIAFELQDHEVVVAESGREALEILRREKDFDLILCDLMMPEVSGVDVYESIGLADPALLSRVVLMTGGAFTARAARFIAERSPALLEKPFQPGQLRDVVDALQASSDDFDNAPPRGHVRFDASRTPKDS
jgi:signal transduction histidine kinase/CheY-like chemotaxis protein